MAMAPVMIAHAVVRWRHEVTFRRTKDRILLGALAALSAALTGLWPAIIASSPGRPTAIPRPWRPGRSAAS